MQNLNVSMRPWSSLVKEFSANRLRPSMGLRRACSAGSNPAGRTTFLFVLLSVTSLSPKAT